MKNKIRNKVYNIIFVVFVIVLLFFLFSKQTLETFTNSTPNGDNTTPDVQFPFKNILLSCNIVSYYVRRI